MFKAIFFDRDGVINKERGEYNYLPEHFIINEGVIEFCKFMKNRNFLYFIISNQGGIAKGIYKKEDVEKLHNYLIESFKKEQIDFTEIYYCPHHDAIEKCLCRKPNSLLLEKAIARFDIDIENSYFIGDTKRDIEAAEKVGLKGILITPNNNLNNYVNYF